MKKILPLILLTLVCLGANAQSRKYISQYNAAQSYFNPAMTAYNGSSLNSIVRNQWMGLDGSPSTTYFNAEVDFGELGGEEDPALLGKNAAGINIMFDQHGPFAETDITFNYSTRVRLTANHSLRFGTGVNFTSVRLDGGALTPEQENDPTIGKYLGGFADMQSLDLHLGAAFTHTNYYAGFSVGNASRGRFNRGDAFLPHHPLVYSVQVGYREILTEHISVIGTGLFRSQAGVYENIELNVKGLVADTFWLGLGHRVNHSNNIQFGVLLLHQFKVGYVFEYPTNTSHRLPGTTHEFVASLRLGRTHIRRNSREILTW